MLQISQLKISYNKQVVLSDVNVNFCRGQVSGLIGKNSSGKTSFFKAVCQLIPYQGNIYFNERTIKRTSVAYLPTENFFYYNLTGSEYLSVFPDKIKEGDELFQKLVGYFDLPLSERISQYSTGMKKKLALLGIFKLNREVYLLDEPFNGLDIESVFVLKKAIEILKGHGKVIIVTSHVIELLANICDASYIILDNHIIEKNLEEINSLILPKWE